MDEKAFQRGHSNATIVGDAVRGVVIDVGEAEIKFVQNPLLNCLLAEKKGAVKTVTTDMWKGYITTTQELFPEASLIQDRVH